MSDQDLLKSRVAALGEEVARLRQEVHELRLAVRARTHPVEQILAQRGFSILSHGDADQLLFPPDLPEAGRNRLFHLMNRYSFRLFLRDLIQFPEGGDMNTLTRYCSLRTVRSYLKELEEMHTVQAVKGGGYRLRRTHVPSFGPTLEWHVSEILQRGFLAPALFGVKLKDTRFGGDYDVISVLAHRLAYVEVKSSPPRGVELPNVVAFLNRLWDLQPHVALFLVDTELRMKDKIVPLFEEALSKSAAKSNAPAPERLVDEIFHLNHVIYLTNSRKGIYSNLRRCLHDYFRYGGTGGMSITTLLEGGTERPQA